MAKKSDGMSESALVALLDRAVETAQTYADGDVAALRNKALQFVNGEVDFPAEDGKSRVVSHDVADTLHWVLPSLLRVFLGSDNVGIYEPRRQEIIEEMVQGPEGPVMQRRDVSDERAAQATDYVNYAVMNECNGYSVLHSALYDGLLFGNGLIKHWWDDTPEYCTEDFDALSEDQFTALAADDDVEVIEHTAYDDPDWTPPPMPEPDAAMAMAGEALSQGVPPEAIRAQAEQLAEAMQPPQLHKCRIKRVTSTGRLRVEALPHEEFFIGSSDISIDEDRSLLCGHSYRETRSNLRKQGYAKHKIDQIPAASSRTMDETKTIRRGPVDEREADWATEEVEIRECYIKVDYDGDGLAEWRKVVLGGNSGARVLLSNDEWGDDLPFSDLVPDPVPHRWRGRSIFDETADIQRIKTQLMRQTMDNLYQTNNPQNLVREGQVLNPDALMNKDLGANIYVKGDGAVQPLVVPFVARESFGMLEYLDMVREQRTGVSRMTTGLDMDALQNQTATAVNAAQSAAYSKQEAYARNIAEKGMKRLFKCLLRLIVKYQDRKRTIRLRGDWVEMDPTVWHADMDVIINTGLGSGSRERDLSMLNAVLNEQKQIIERAGPFNPVADIRKFRDTLAKMVEIAGLRSPERYFSEMSDEDLQAMKQQSQEQGPDPKMMEAQAKLQAEAQRKQAEMQFQFQLQSEKAQADLHAFREKAAMELQLARDKATEELRLLREKQDLQFRLRMREMAMEAQLKQQKIAAAAEGVRPYGQPDNIPRPQL